MSGRIGVESEGLQVLFVVDLADNFFEWVSPGLFGTFILLFGYFLSLFDFFFEVLFFLFPFLLQIRPHFCYLIFEII